MMYSAKHILIIKTSFGLGGIERSLIEFLRHLDYSRYDVDLLLLWGPFDLCAEIPSQVRLLNVENSRIRLRLSPLYVLYYILSLFFRICSLRGTYQQFKQKKQDVYYRSVYSYFCKNKRYDVAIAYQQGFACEYTARFVAADKRIMMYHHGEIEDAEYLRPWFHQADVVLTVAKGVDAKLIQAFPFLQGNTAVIENYEDAETIRKMANENKPALSPNEINLCTCGRLSPEKGFDLAIAAAMILRHKGVRFHWYFVGSGYQQDYVESICQKIKNEHLDDFITITGFLSNPFPYIKHCDILVVPSRFEGNPMIIHEGKILQKPIVATRTNGAKDLLQDKITGVICDISAESIAEAILSLSSSRDLREQLVNELGKIDFLASRKAFYAKWEKLLAN